MTASAHELAALRTVATHLGALRAEMVFVGGMIRSLLISDPAAPPARPTDDVDVIAAIATLPEYYAIAEKLRRLGFREDQSAGAPLCRWIIHGLKVDVMPDHENVLGFSNRWYPLARETATWHTIGNEDLHRIRVVDAPHFVATKLESFRGRGGGDFYHHDVEDFIAIVDGREELLRELTSCPELVRAFIAAEVCSLMTDNAFVEALPGHLAGDKASQARLSIVEKRLVGIAALQT